MRPLYLSFLKKRGYTLQGKCVLITGGNSGIGFACARYALCLGARVILCCRSPQRGQAALEALRAEFPTGAVTLESVDLADLTTVDALCARLGEQDIRVHVLLHCAGVYYPRERTTAQGLPATVGINYVGTVRLTEGLLPSMGAQDRVIFTTSLVDRFGRVFANAPSGRKREGYAAYAESKLLLSAYALQKARTRKADQPAFLAVHPGITATSLLDPTKTTHKPLFSRIGHAALQLLTHSKEKAALTALFAACGTIENGACIGPRGLLGISGYPHRTRFCHRVRRQAKHGNNPYTG